MIYENGRIKISNLENNSLVLRRANFYGEGDASNRPAQMGVVTMVDHSNQSVTVCWLHNQTEEKIVFFDMEYDFCVIPTLDIIGPYG